jgi:hypothetical protein
VTAIDTLIQQIGYQNTPDTPASTRTISITVNDGDGGTSTAQTSLITVNPSNDPPAIANLPAIIPKSSGKRAGIHRCEPGRHVTNPDSADNDGGSLALVQTIGNGERQFQR